jgi:hypothetical protein
VKHHLSLLLLLLLPGSLVADVILIDSRVRAGYEELTLPDNESLGLLGLGYLIDKRLSERASFYYGLGVYSAVTGQRGGFFTGGVEAGLQYSIGRLVLDGGFFAGGGGGGAAPQGGGLMLRPHVGLLYDVGNFQIGLEYSKVRFPNGNIDSDQLGVVAGFSFQSVLARDDTRIPPGQQLTMASVTITPTLQHYSPANSAVQATGVGGMELAGIELGRLMSDNSYFFLESAAAAGGDADGYAELLGGVGYRYPLGERFALRGRLAAGAAGGGAVDTGGGFVYKASIGAELKLTHSLSLGLDYGLIDAPDGTFEAGAARVTLGYTVKMAAASGYGTPVEPRSLSLGRWALRLSHQTYLSDPTLRKTPGGGDVNLIALKLDRDLGKHLYVTGMAAAAYEGSAGGYAAGMFGIGYHHQLSDRLAIRGELLAGPGGGGGLDTRGGALFQPMIGLTYRLTRSLDLALMAGKLRAFEGGLDTEVVDVGLVYRFETLESR